MFGTFLSFSAPWVLLAFSILPVLWWLLRVTPPQPQRVIFPPLKILLDLVPKSEVPAATPWPLLLLRMLIISLLILACAGPTWTERPATQDKSPLLLLIDNGATSAKTWDISFASARAHLSEAEEQGRLVAVLPLADLPQPMGLTTATESLERLRSIEPKAYMANRSLHLANIRLFLQQNPNGTLLWLSDGLSSDRDKDFIGKLEKTLENHRIHIEVPENPPALGLQDVSGKSGNLSVTITRGVSSSGRSGTVQALNNQSIVIAESPFKFEQNQTASPQKTAAIFDVPLELRNTISQFRIREENSALGTFLTDSRTRQAYIGIVSVVSKDIIQPLLKPSYYVERALAPFAAIKMPTGSPADQIRELLGANRIQNSGFSESSVSTILLVDTGALDKEVQSYLTRFVEEGGLVVRFAGSQLSSTTDSLLPVKIREGGRLLGGVMSWDAPKKMAPFPEKSPFSDLPPTKEVSITRQILAEPDGDLMDKTWAALEDGTPLVTAQKKGKGLIVLFHVSADNRWSDLPLSGLFADMLQRIVALSVSQLDAVTALPDLGAQVSTPQTSSLPPRLILDGFGQLDPPPPWAAALPSDFKGIAQPQNPAGYYGTATEMLAVNVLSSLETLDVLKFSNLNASIEHKFRAASQDLRALALLIAFGLFGLDILVSLLLSGFILSTKKMPGLSKKYFSFFSLVVLTMGLAIFSSSGQSHAQSQLPPQSQQNALPPIKPGSFEPALKLRLGYVQTGNTQLDEVSKAGLRGITRVLFQRTSLEPAEPLGVNLEQDELVLFPILYWPISPSNAFPSPKALKKVDAYIQSGGTILFDTRDALRSSINTNTEEAAYLQRLFRQLTIPAIEPIPSEHVLSKTYYLLKSFPGRYTSGQTWIEALPPKDDTVDIGPARGGDSVSPVIISTNDLASAWAIDQNGRPLYPLMEDEEDKQREYAYRVGVNIVMYVLTGNYKTDQVHIPALLERLKR